VLLMQAYDAGLKAYRQAYKACATSQA